MIRTDRTGYIEKREIAGHPAVRVRIRSPPNAAATSAGFRPKVQKAGPGNR